VFFLKKNNNIPHILTTLTQPKLLQHLFIFEGRAKPPLFTSGREVLYVFVSTLVSRSVIHFFLTLALRLGLLSYIALHV
jgi:hypothetical protein